MKLHRGEILGITGLVGAGRSEVLQAVLERTRKKAEQSLSKDRKLTSIILPRRLSMDLD